MPATAQRLRRWSGQAGPRLGRALLRLLTIAGIAAMVLLAVIDATGRVRVVAAPDQTQGTAYKTSDLLIVVPVPAQRLRVGDVVVVRNSKEHALLRIERILDSAGPEVHFAGDPVGRVRKLGGTTYRVRMAVPALGYPMRFLAGPIQALVLVAFGFLLVVRAEVRRGREGAAPAPVPVASSS